MNQTICSAIRSKLIIRFYYNGGSRTVEPFCSGVSTAGNEVLRGYQTGGYSRSGNPVAWKLFEVSQMSGLTFTDNSLTAAGPATIPMIQQ